MNKFKPEGVFDSIESYKTPLNESNNLVELSMEEGGELFP